MQKNDIFEGEVVDLTHEGLGVVKSDNFPFFVENAMPGEWLRLRVTKIGKTFGFARVEEFLSKSDKRVESTNMDYLRTGIADLAHLTYDEQLKFKKHQVETVLSKAGVSVHVADVFPAEEVTGYRNKAQIPVRSLNGELTTGFFRKHSHQLLPIENFYIQNPEIDEIILDLRNLLRESGLTAYDERTNKGLVRNIVVRRAHKTGEIMIVLVLSKAVKIDFSQVIMRFPGIKSIQYSIKTDRGNAIFGKAFEVIYGQNFITDELLGKKFQISAQSFYQVNSTQAERLYQTAYDFADLKPTDTIVDAYSGIGTVGLCVADRVAQVYGMEVVAAAVENAKENAALNGFSNVHYEVGTAEEVMPRWQAQGVRPDVIFVDPPRKGLDESFVKTAAQMSARAIVYISCNPATFARDAVRFEEAGYQLERVQPVDLFPQTHHVELVGKFINNEKVSN
ncbi:MAG: 23S rRNA (uracil(1939)-C(5))-methyltransferase RlmD [Streptococcaceae bacterium]|jgi:23S rRNA (uracil1939-C5)-methyltransferase|nr:23S rRNA (uracil(1939)-C(5))-methyltransferase RlmD [Streptococcaceae bacterium]